jgi:hypothetical protein
MEAGVHPSARLAGDLRRALQRCADWHGTPHLQITSAAPEWREALSVGQDEPETQAEAEDVKPKAKASA